MVFDCVDVDNTQTITLDEMREFIGDMEHMASMKRDAALPKEVQALLAAADKNGDGDLSPIEVIRALHAEPELRTALASRKTQVRYLEEESALVAEVKARLTLDRRSAAKANSMKRVELTAEERAAGMVTPLRMSTPVVRVPEKFTAPPASPTGPQSPGGGLSDDESSNYNTTMSDSQDYFSRPGQGVGDGSSVGSGYDILTLDGEEVERRVGSPVGSLGEEDASLGMGSRSGARSAEANEGPGRRRRRGEGRGGGGRGGAVLLSASAGPGTFLPAIDKPAAARASSARASSARARSAGGAAVSEGLVLPAITPPTAAEAARAKAEARRLKREQREASALLARSDYRSRRRDTVRPGVRARHATLTVATRASLTAGPCYCLVCWC